MEEIIKEGVKYLKENDDVIKNLIEKCGDCNLKPSRTYFKNLVKSIISQQLSKNAAHTIHSRLVKRLNYQVNPQFILKLQLRDFNRIGVSKQKAKYLKELSKTYLRDSKFFKKLSQHSNAEIINELTKIKGIGVWTAQMFLIFSLNRLNILAYDDVGLKNAIKKFYSIKHVSKGTFIKLSKNWGNYSSIAAWYLWWALDNKY